MTGQARRGPIVTVDGPAGSGKSSTAREVARRLGFRHLDSGALYRALTWALLESGHDPATWDGLTVGELAALGVEVNTHAQEFAIRVGQRVLDDELRTDRVTNLVSAVARIPAVRETLLELQRGAGATGRLVADGRDMGTVVFPCAEVKVFLTADLTERARRRLAEQGVEHPDDATLSDESARLEARDRRDSERAVSPLRRPDDAVDLDTTHLSFEAQVEAVVDLVRTRTGTSG